MKEKELSQYRRDHLGYKLVAKNLQACLWDESHIIFTIDRDRCISEFGKYYSKEEALIKRIETNRIKVLNSGIKIV